jgi:hypothetical protein
MRKISTTQPSSARGDDLTSVIHYLDQVETRPSNIEQSKTERIANKITRYALIFSGSFFVVLCLAAAVHKLLYALPPSLLPWIVGVGIVSQLSAIFAMAMQTVAGISLIFFFKREATTHRKNALAHDIQSCGPLLKYKPETLHHADAWLAQFITRQERWQNMFIPGSDKLAILSYFGATVAIFNQFMSTMSDTGKYVPWLSHLNINIDPFYLALPLAMLFGVALAGVFNRIDIYRMQYKRDLIALALASPSMQKALQPTGSGKSA